MPTSRWWRRTMTMAGSGLSQSQSDCTCRVRALAHSIGSSGGQPWPFRRERQRRAGAGRGAPSGVPRRTGLAASAKRVRHHAHRHCLSEESEANAASLAMRPQDRAPQGSRRVQRSTAPVKRRDRPPHAFAAPQQTTQRTACGDARQRQRNPPTAAGKPPDASGRQQTGPTTKHANPQAGPTPSQPSSRICRPVSLRNRSSRFAGRCSVRNCGQATRASSNGRASWV